MIEDKDLTGEEQHDGARSGEEMSANGKNDPEFPDAEEEPWDPWDDNDYTRSLHKELLRTETEFLEAVKSIGTGDLVDYRRVANLATQLANINDEFLTYVAG